MYARLSCYFQVEKNKTQENEETRQQGSLLTTTKPIREVCVSTVGTLFKSTSVEQWLGPRLKDVLNQCPTNALTTLKSCHLARNQLG